MNIHNVEDVLQYVCDKAAKFNEHWHDVAFLEYAY